MIQFYFLSIVLNLLTGFVLFQEPQDSTESSSWIFLNNNTFRLFLGFGSIIVSLLKILSSFQGDLPIIGDFFPALTGFVGGFTLIFEFYRNKSSVTSEQSEKLAHFIAGKRKLIGGIIMLSGVLHFLFPQALLL